MGHDPPSDSTVSLNADALHGHRQLGHVAHSSRRTRFPLAMHMGISALHASHVISVSGPLAPQCGHADVPSSASDLSGLRTTLSIFRRYGSAICERSSGEPTSFCANSSAVRFMPARTHSMTVEVRMGTTCAGNLEMFRETRAKSRAAPS